MQEVGPLNCMGTYFLMLFWFFVERDLVADLGSLCIHRVKWNIWWNGKDGLPSKFCVYLGGLFRGCIFLNYVSVVYLLWYSFTWSPTPKETPIYGTVSPSSLNWVQAITFWSLQSLFLRDHCILKVYKVVGWLVGVPLHSGTPVLKASYCLPLQYSTK